MFGRYRFRVQIPTSGARFVPGHGILSRQALEQLSEFPDRSPFDMKVDIPDPKDATDTRPLAVGGFKINRCKVFHRLVFLCINAAVKNNNHNSGSIT